MKVHVLHMRNYFRRSSGAVLIELTFVLLILLPLVLYTVNFGLALYEYQTLVRQVRAGTRYLTTQYSNDPSVTSVTFNNARCIVLYAPSMSNVSLASACASASTPVLKNLKSSMITVADSTTDPTLKVQSTLSAGSQTYATTVNLVKITITGYDHLLPGFGSIRFAPISSVMRQLN